MKVLIKKARIIDPSSSLHNSVQDILVDADVIREINPSIDGGAEQIVEASDLLVSPGWVDCFANFCDPGYEFKETLASGSTAASAGGFTDVFVIPNTRPVIDNKSQVEYITRSAEALDARVHALGAISRGTEGKELAEMYDMRQSGAVAFTDGTSPVQSAGLLLKALQYVKAFDGVVIQIPDDKSVGANGLVHEGIVSTRLGLAGKPMMAEELLVARDIKLARYAESKLHFTGVTSPRSLEYIRRAKDSGLSVTCSVTPYHLFFTDEELHSYDTNLKVFPPLRTGKEREALRQAIKDGTIDCIATHHMPQDYDNKVLEFEYAKNGMTGLETCYAALRTAMPDISDEKWVALLSTNPRKIFGLPDASVGAGKRACLTLFSRDGDSKITDAYFYSKSKNSAFKGKTLSGNVIGTINGIHRFMRNK